jgi:ABC-type transport system involved in cytochrome bd biosynthesis fused ATPase/permease subunit
MKEKELSESLAGVRLSELNRMIEKEEMFESLRPRAFAPLVYILNMTVVVTLYIVFGVFDLNDEKVVMILFMLILMQPLSVLQESKKINKRIDILYDLVKNKHSSSD